MFCIKLLFFMFKYAGLMVFLLTQHFDNTKRYGQCLEVKQSLCLIKQHAMKMYGGKKV